MNLRNKILLGILALGLLIGVYVTLVMDNIFLRISNYSDPVHMRILIEEVDSKNSINYLFEDSIPSAKTSHDEFSLNTRRSTSRDYIVRIIINNEQEIYEEIIHMEKIQIIYVTVTPGIDEPRVIINTYNLKEAWNMNLLFGQEG